MIFEDRTEMRKFKVSQLWSRGLWMAFLLVVLMAGCGQQQAGIPLPTLTAISPTSGTQGLTVPVTLTGTNFSPGCTVGVTGTGITISSTTVVSSTQITTSFVIGATATPGAVNVTVTCPGGTTTALPFTVLGPSLTLIAPNNGTQGQTVPVTLTGTLFGVGCTVGVTGTGITVSNTVIVNATQMTATFTIALTATTGPRNVTVTCPGGTTTAQVFTVNALPPTVTSTSPANGDTAVPINRKITATFNKPMNGTTITTGSTFTVTGLLPVAGTVTYDAASNTAIFSPLANLPANTTFTALISAAAQDTSGNALVSGGSAPNPWTFTTGAVADVTAPRVILSTDPANLATAVPLNKKITATFSEAMNPATITTTTFTVTGPGVTPVAGTVTYAAVSHTATFTPTANLAPSTLFTATITVGATDSAGNPLTTGGAPNPWTFTTGTTPDSTAPTVTLTKPVNAAPGVPINTSVNATFSEAMDPSTINNGTFTLVGPGITPVSGTVTYDPASKVATFKPSANLAINSTFTATVTTGAKDLAGNALVSGLVPNPWTFTTGAVTAGQPPVNLGSAATFGSFGGGAGITNQGINTVINGDIGTTAASTLVTGFHDAGPGCTYTETPLNVGIVNGLIYTAAPPPTVGCPSEGTAATFAIASQAALDALAAFNNLSPASRPGGTDPGAGQLGGLTLAPGLYQAAGGSFLITGSDLTLDAQGDANALFIFQTASTLTVGAAGAPRSIILINGAQAKNVYWQVGSAATINAAGGGTMVGTIIASTGVSFSTAGNAAVVTLNGRALALNASVTMVNTVINVP